LPLSWGKVSPLLTRISSRCDAFHVRRGGFAAVITVLLALTAGTASDRAGAGPEANRGGQIHDPLLGTWDTGRIRFDRVRASLNAAGYTEAEVRTFLGDAGLDNAVTWRFDLTFYREHGVASLIRTGWDPELTAMPSDGEHVRYRLLPKH